MARLARLDRHARGAFVERLDRRLNVPLTVVAMALAPVLIAPDQLDPGSPTRGRLVLLGWLLWGVFAAAFGARLVLVPDRLDYLRHHAVEAAVVVGPALLPLGEPRTIRLWWAVAAGARAVVGFRRALDRRGLAALFVAATLVVAIAADLVLDAERADPDATIATYGDALWWAVSTVTSVGYGDRYPRTATGRAIGIGLMLLGIGLFGVLTARLATYFVEADESAFDRRMDALDARLDRIEVGLRRRAKRRRKPSARARPGAASPRTADERKAARQQHRDEKRAGEADPNGARPPVPSELLVSSPRGRGRTTAGAAIATPTADDSPPGQPPTADCPAE